MDTFNEQNVIINLKLLKRFQFFQIFGTSGTKIFGWNLHQLYFAVHAVIGLCFYCYGISGLFFKTCNINYIEYILVFVITTNVTVSLWMLITILKNVDRFLDLLKITQINFLKINRYSNNYHNILHKHRDKTIMITNIYMYFFIVLALQWFIFPLGNNMLVFSGNSNVRSTNIINLCCNVPTQTYNQYFIIFYIMELTSASIASYTMVMTDLLLMSLSSAIMAQQDVLIHAFKNIGHEENPQKSYYEELKSIIQDQLQLNMKIKLLHSILKPNILSSVAIDSANFIIMIYVFILVLLTSRSDTMVLILVKVGTGVIFYCLRVFICCYRFDNINSQRELINFSIYSCNWTEMDLKFKKLLLLMMRMNDANQILMKASPIKIINLQLFSSIMSASYNIVSVMLKTTSLKNHISE